MFARETMAGHGMLFCLQEAALLYHVLDVEVTVCSKIYVSRCIAKSLYLEKLKRIIIWNRGSTL